MSSRPIAASIPAAVVVGIRMSIGAQSAKGKWFVVAAFVVAVPLMLFFALLQLNATR